MIVVPLQAYDLLEIDQGSAIVIIGMFAILLWASVTFRNPLALISWGTSIFMFVFSGLLGLGFELVWMALVVNVFLIIIGVVARWSQ